MNQGDGKTASARTPTVSEKSDRTIRSYPTPEGIVKAVTGDPNHAQFANASWDATAVVVQFADGHRFEFPAAGLRVLADKSAGAGEGVHSSGRGAQRVRSSAPVFECYHCGKVLIEAAEIQMGCCLPCASQTVDWYAPEA